MYIAVIAPLIISLIACPIIISICKKFDIYDEVDPRKIHTGSVPRLGGIAIFLAFFASIPFCFRFLHFDSSRHIPVLAGLLVTFLTGVTDDFLNMRARVKFLAQILAASCVMFSPCYFDSIFGWKFPFDFVTGRIIAFGWILLVVNAYNLIDGMDWLCGGLSIFALLGYGVIFSIKGFGDESLIFALCAAIAGFMFWNRPKARIFMGDGGSLSIGYALAVFPLLPVGDAIFSYNRLLLAFLICSIPVIDVFAAIVRRKREHRSFFSPDRRHLHHKLLNIGFSGFLIRLLLFTIQILISTVAVFTAFVGRKTGTALLISAFSFTTIFFASVHYINLAVTRKMGGHLADHPMQEH